MKFHTPSFLLGFSSATVLALTGKRLKPIAVELGALGLHLGRLAWGVIERQRETIEDTWAEMENRAHERRQRNAKTPSSPGTQRIHIEASTPRNGSTEARH